MFALSFFGAIAAWFSWFQSTPPHDHHLVRVQNVIPSIVIDIKYATNDNFTGQVLYPSAECYLLEHVANALKEVQDELNAQGFGLKIWDAYRPFSVQKIMWDVVKDTPNQQYVANPAMGGKHTRGTAVDLTLVFLSTGHELPMPTPFDDFTERAWRASMDCSYVAQVNRRLLETVMHKHGFVGIPHEWWHFDYQDWRDHEPLDIDFDAL